MSSATSQPTSEPSFFYSVPNEICVVVSLDPGHGLNLAQWHTLVYEPVRAFMNGELHRLLNQTRGDGDHLGPDFIPTKARSQYASDLEILRPLARPRVGSPWVGLTRSDGRTTGLHFYQVGQQTMPGEDWKQDDAQVVRELVNLINRSVRYRRPDAVPGAITAATPNWLFSASTNGGSYTGGGPATEPQPVPPGSLPSGAPKPYRYQFDYPALQQLVNDQRAAAESGATPKVVVAVLDTCPKPEDVRAKADNVDNSFPVVNWLLKEVADNVHIDQPQFVPPDYFDFLAQMSPGDGTRAPHEDIRDHGLFSAGIIRDIAPTADIYLIRVLDDTGVGDLQLLTTVLTALPSLLVSSGQKLVINLSLMATLPAGADLPKHWFPNVTQDPGSVLRLWTEMCAAFEAIHASLAEVVAWLAEMGVQVVAAAGNDAKPGTPPEILRPEPRYPARYDTVVGVAAVNLAGGPSAFSNQGDFTQMGNGVAVFGGDGVDPVTDAVVGIFSHTFPDGSANGTGWAYWSGTSFATPVMSAIAADLWTVDPSIRPADLITRLTRLVGSPGTLPDDTPGVTGQFATDPKPELACAAIKAWQEPR